MRNFPNAWVLPGGHLDPGENIEYGALREIREETGITDADYNLTKLKPLIIYESAIRRYEYEGGPPVGGHIIIFFLLQLSKKSFEVELTLQ